MSFFGKSAKQRLKQSGFTITKTLFEAPRLSMVPSLYMDENHRKWAMVLHGMEPAIHDYEDILDCKVIENEEVDVRKDMSRRDLFESVLENPAAVARANASRGGKYCTRMDVALTVRGTPGQESTIGIPLIGREVLRSSKTYVLLRQGADKLCEDVLRMRDASKVSS